MATHLPLTKCICFLQWCIIFFIVTFCTRTVGCLASTGNLAVGAEAIAPDARTEVRRVAARIDFNMIVPLFYWIASEVKF